ncbi:MAG: amino acid adenylation domain-containing protein [Cyanobacteria bacterium]|jgi:amino acid adenylation domain-containing protein/non-ribosomal peptide synthase protein (TIGR01720 family)|nr:amino acid adenylation domain-containing protein [Cyanobacteria bacterium GSL.Bin1]
MTKKPEGFQLSPQQQRLWQRQQQDSAFPYRVIGEALLEGELEPQRLEVALTQVISQQEILRTFFANLPEMETPLQAIAEDNQYQFRYDDLSQWEETVQQEKREAWFEQGKQQPLDLETGQVLDVTLLKLAPERHVLLVTLPALCGDVVTLKNFLAELNQAYAGIERTEEPLQYADIAAWQNDLFESEEGEIGRGYWRQQPLASGLTLKLPFQLKLNTDSAFQPNMVTHSLGGSDQLESIAQDYQVSVETLLFACWQVLLWRLTGETELIVGRHCNGRNYEELTSALGPFAKVLPIRTQLDPSLPLRDLCQQIASTVQEVETWQESFNWHDIIGNSAQLPFLPLSFESFSSSKTETATELTFCLQRQYCCLDRFYLKLSCHYRGEQRVTEWHYDPQCFNPADIERLASQFQTLAEAVSQQPERPIGELPILSQRDREQILVKFNNTAKEYPPPQCIHHHFEVQAQEHPNRMAAVSEADKLTYAELNTRANQLAHYLQTCGVAPDVPVALYVERSLELLIGLLGIFKAGGAYVPIDSGLPQEGLRFRLRDASAPVILTQESLVRDLPALEAQVLCLDQDWETIAATPTHPPSSSVTPKNLAYLLYTSGSSGQPKGVAVEHQQLDNYLNAIAERLDLQSERHFALVSTFAADLSNTAIFPALCSGGCLHILPREQASNPAALATYGAEHPIDCLKIVPSHLKALLASPDFHHFLPRKRLILGGEAVDPQLVAQVQEQVPECQIFNHYGPTETTVGVVAGHLVGQETTNMSPLGHPLGNTQVYLLDADLHPVPIGVPGELYVGGAQVTRGYWHRPELTAECFIPDPFSTTAGSRLYRTGDWGYYLSDGTIQFIGRRDRQIKLRGFRLELGEIEAVLQQEPTVQTVAVKVWESQEGQSQVIAYVVLQGNESVDEDALRHFLHQRLPDYMIPTSFVPLKALPLTANGKIDYQGLPDPAETATRLQKDNTPPRNSVEQHLVDIWRQVLGLDQVGIHDNFFALGGDSILSIRAIAKASQVGLKLTPRQLFQYQTIAQLATVVEVTTDSQAQQGLVTGSLPLTPVQQWFFEQHLSEPHHWNQAVLLEAQQPLNFSFIQSAIAHLLEHHDGLRLRFEPTAEGWKQFNAGVADTLPCLQIDLSAFSSDQQNSAIATTATELHRSLNLSEGPLLRVAQFNLGPEKRDRLLITIHHLAVDGVSWRILLEDLQTVYQQLSDGKTVELPPKTTAFKDWSEQLKAHAQSVTCQQELDYWLTTLGNPISSLPIDHDKGANTFASADTVSATLSVEETQTLLQEIPTSYRTQIDEILLTAFVQSLLRWTGSSVLLLDLEGHGRETFSEALDISRTVGWFTTIFPVQLAIDPQSSVMEALKTIKEQLRQIPQQGMGYGLLHYLNDNSVIRQQLQALPQAEMRLNYLGQFDPALSDSSLFTLAPEASGQARSPIAQRPYLLDITGWVAQQQLQLDWTYSRAVHDRRTIEQLADQFLKVLRSLIAESKSGQGGADTPSDFPKANLNQADLDKLLTRMTNGGNA